MMPNKRNFQNNKTKKKNMFIRNTVTVFVYATAIVFLFVQQIFEKK